jgi:sec-independent protein translocase protein TatA
MVGDILQPTHLLFILVVALLVLGPKRLPEVARMLGNGLRDFRSAISGESRDDHDDDDGHEPQAIAQAYEDIRQEGPPPAATFYDDGDDLDHMRIYAERADDDAPQPEPDAAEPEPVAAKPEPVAAKSEPAAQTDKSA